jgi:hypothetical protein
LAEPGHAQGDLVPDAAGGDLVPDAGVRVKGEGHGDDRLERVALRAAARRNVRI